VFDSASELHAIKSDARELGETRAGKNTGISVIDQCKSDQFLDLFPDYIEPLCHTGLPANGCLMIANPTSSFTE